MTLLILPSQTLTPWTNIQLFEGEFRVQPNLLPERRFHRRSKSLAGGSDGVDVGREFAIIGAGAVVAATTQGPIYAVVLLIELTGRDRSFIVPQLAAVSVATLISRTLDPRSIHDARLTDAQLAERQKSA